MLGLKNSLRSGSLMLSDLVQPDADESLFSVGEAGQAPNSVVFLLDPIDQESTTVYETTTDSFLHLNTSDFDETTTFSDVKTEIETSAEGIYDDWEFVISNDLTYTDSNNMSYLPHDNPNPNPFNYLNTHLFNRDKDLLDQVAWGTTISNLLTAPTWDLTFMVVFQLGNSGSEHCILKKELPVDQFDTFQKRYSELSNASGWQFQVGIGSSLGTLIHTTHPGTNNYKNIVFAASARSHVSDFALFEVPSPQTYVNSYDTNSSSSLLNTNGLGVNVLSAYGDILDPNRLLNLSVERYNKSSDYKDEADFQSVIPGGDNTTLAAGLVVDEPIEIVSINSGNREITVKVIFASSILPPSPWFNRAPNEYITARAKIINLRDGNGTNGLLNGISVYDASSNIVEATDNSPITQTLSIAGETVYFAVHTYKFDVSGVNVYATAAEKAALGIASGEQATTLDLSRQAAGSEDPAVRYHNAMIFRIEELSFKTNVKNYGAPVTGLKTLSNVLVPTMNIPNYTSVGADASIFMLEQSGTDGVVDRSVKSGVVAPLLSADEFLFEFDASRDTSVDVTSSNNSTPVVFENRSGALNANSEFVYIDQQDQQTKFSGFVKLSIDESVYSSDPNISLDLKLVLNEQEIDLGVTPTYSTSGSLGVYEWTFNNVFVNVTGATDFSVKEVVFLRAKVENGSRTDGDYVITIDSNSTFSGVEDNTAQSPAPPETDPNDLTGQQIKTVPKYNKYN